MKENWKQEGSKNKRNKNTKSFFVVQNFNIALNKVDFIRAIGFL